jgi:hypothetical protein
MPSQNIFDLTDTWNVGATTFTAIKMNVTDTASASGSLLMDLQVGGASRFRISKSAEIVRDAGGNFNSILDNSGLRITSPSGASATLRMLQTGVIDLTFANEANSGFAVLGGTSTFEQRSGTSAQTFRLYNTFTDASNYERVALKAETTYFRIITEKAGTGSARALAFGTDNLNRWEINTSGHFLAATDNTYDIGASGATRPRNVYVGTNIVAGDTVSAGNFFVGATGLIVFNGRTGINSDADGTLRLRNNAGTDFNRLQFGGTTSSCPAMKRSTTCLEVRRADDSAFAPFASGRATIDTLTVGLGGQTAVATNTALGFEALNSASLTGANTIAVGYQALTSLTTGGASVAVGHSALLNATTGTDNTAVGYQAARSLTTGNNNVVMGVDAGFALTTQSNNIAVGKLALRYFNTSNNTAVGFEAARGSVTVANNTGGNLIAVGHQALLSNTSGGENNAVGHSALLNNTTGSSNVALGHGSLFANTTGASNSAVGRDALGGNTTASNNSAVGQSALRYFNTSDNVAVGFEAARGSTVVANNTGNKLTAVGAVALLNNTSGTNNSAVGKGALNNNTTGNNNSAMGGDALVLNTTGANNSAVGAQALLNNSTGSDNSALGLNALVFNTTGASNSATGGAALGENTTGSNSTAVGFQAAQRFVASQNTALGYRALRGGDATPANNTGANNIGIGFQAGDAITTGSTNLVIGYDIDVDSPTASNQINIGDRYFHNRMRLVETTDPAAPAADNAIIFARDNGSGKTQICVRFPTGAVQVISTEP